MKLPAILVSDLHLTSNPRDEYRWALFPWLVELCKKHKVKTVCILGDLTDAKDNHGSVLVNRVVESVLSVRDASEDVFIMQGNHDYLKEGHAFFSFLSEYPQVRFCDRIFSDQLFPASALFLPHTKTPEKDWEHFDFAIYDFVFMHQTFHGSLASNGQKMDSSLESVFEVPKSCKLYSGDIHVPQVIGDVEYVGSPYHVHFGDKFKARAILLDERGRATDFHMPSLTRVKILADSVEDYRQQLAQLQAGDQIKVEINLAPEDRPDWDKVRRRVSELAKQSGIALYGVELKARQVKRVRIASSRKVSSQTSPEDIVVKFVQQEDLGGDILNTALEIMQ